MAQTQITTARGHPLNATFANIIIIIYRFLFVGSDRTPAPRTAQIQKLAAPTKLAKTIRQVPSAIPIASTGVALIVSTI